MPLRTLPFWQATIKYEKQNTKYQIQSAMSTTSKVRDLWAGCRGVWGLPYSPSMASLRVASSSCVSSSCYRSAPWSWNWIHLFSENLVKCIMSRSICKTMHNGKISIFELGYYSTANVIHVWPSKASVARSWTKCWICSVYGLKCR